MPRRGNSSASSSNHECFLCGRSCSNRCPNCRLVHYCSREHYAYHHQREYCFPYRISWNEVGGGHCVVATRNVRPLELVLFEWNLVVGPGLPPPPKSEPPPCSECLRPVADASSRCVRCGLAVCPDHLESTKHLESAECRLLARADSPGWKEANYELLSLAVMPIRYVVVGIPN